jgi:hypothetical protein
MKAALALVFFACIAGSMASDARLAVFDQLLAQGQIVAQTIITQLQQSIQGLVQQAFGQLSSLVGSLGGRFDLNALLEQFNTVLAQFANGALGQILSGLTGLIGGMFTFLTQFFLSF